MTDHGFRVKVIEDSASPSGVRLTTLQLRYPRFIHAEFMTHRVFSRNASSSRAIPVAKVIEQVRNDPATPIHWGRNQPGMQAMEGFYKEWDREWCRAMWIRAANKAADIAEEMMNFGLHKQVANRILEPFQFMHVVTTATEWENFFALRDHQDAEPNIQLLARMMKAAMGESSPKSLAVGEWHLPYITQAEREQFTPEILAPVSAARCARVSYLKHDGSAPNMEEDLKLYDRLVGSKPEHASPVEHQATPFDFAEDRDCFSGNFRGWYQFRKQLGM